MIERCCLENLGSENSVHSLSQNNFFFLFLPLFFDLVIGYNVFAAGCHVEGY